MSAHAPLLEDVVPETEEFAAQASPLPWPSSGQAWKTLWILSAVLGLSQVDRNILGLLVTPIKADLHLNFTQIGLLTGAAFSAVYLITSFPLSRISDLWIRKAMISIGVAVWSVSTAACGLASGFWQMFAARAGVGAGESVNAPATYSLLADSFPRDKLPRAMAILNLGFVVGGTGFSLFVGGMVIAALEHVHVALPGIGVLRNWQLVFMAIGLPGLVIAALVLWIQEPHRRGAAGKVAARGTVPISEVFAFLARNGRLYGCLFAAVFIDGVVIYGGTALRQPFFQLTYHWKAQQMGVVVGLVSIVTSPIALAAGTWLAEAWNKKHADANMRIAIVARAFAIPLSVAGPLMPNAWLSVACTSAAAAIVLVATPALGAALQSMTPPNVRAQVNSLYLMLFSGVTAVIGPVLIGFITDLMHDETKLRYVLAGSAAVGSPIALAIMWFAVKPYGQIIAGIRAEEARAAEAGGTGAA
jgi:MFS family permease